MRSTKMVEWLWFGRILWWICCPSGRLLVSLLPTRCVQIRRRPCKLPKFLLSRSTSSVVLARKFLIQTQQVRKSSSLIGFFDLGDLQSWGRSLRFWSLHLSLGLVVSPEWVVPMRVGTHRWVPCLLNRRFLSILMWHWLGLLISRVCRMGWVFHSFWECNFCNNLRSPDTAAKPFSIWGISVYSRNFESCEFAAKLPRMKCFFQGIQPTWHQSGTFQLLISILHCECTGRLPECSGWGP